MTKKVDKNTKLFIAKLMEELESTQVELASREETLTKRISMLLASWLLHFREK
jgi:hypothetical protein